VEPNQTCRWQQCRLDMPKEGERRRRLQRCRTKYIWEGDVRTCPRSPRERTQRSKDSVNLMPSEQEDWTKVDGQCNVVA
jgi:hypothetical protein